jgi:hypothetical protein
LKEDSKKFNLIIPVFQFKNKENITTNVFLKDSFSVGLSKDKYQKFKEKLKTRIKIKLPSFTKKDEIYHKIPKTLKNPNNRIVILYEHDNATINIIDEFMCGVEYKYVNINYLFEV